MKTYPVSGPALIDPFWFARARQGRHASVVEPGHTLLVEGVSLRLTEDAPEPGTAVRVWLSGSGFFVCATVDDIERESQARRDAEAAEAAHRRQRLNARRVEAEAFNARIALPAKWDVGIKDVLPGLSECSWGDGRSKATVEHIHLLEPLVQGRLTREAGDFLCTSANGANGKRWSSKVAERRHDGDGQPYQPIVSCKACLVLARKWMKEPRA